LGNVSALLESYSYQRVLDRGFALMADGDGKTIASVTAVAPGDDISLRLSDGVVGARITKGGDAKPKRLARPKHATDDKPQGSLL